MVGATGGGRVKLENEAFDLKVSMPEIERLDGSIS